MSRLHEAVALALIFGDWDDSDLDAVIPQDVWESLYARDLLGQGADLTGDGYPFLTRAGKAYLVNALAAPPSPEQEQASE